jgi:D-alanyl-D-alanine carboxypeptidase (penicillin-binding protein 5/6)
VALLLVWGAGGYAQTDEPSPDETSLPAGCEQVAEPVLTAEAAVLLDATTGRVLWEHNSHRRMYPASLTKMMSGLIAIERGELQREYVASKRAANTGESSIALAAGEKLTLEQVLQASLIKSANDATVMLAEAVGGSVEAFVAQMNQQAQQSGLTGTHFENPHGLHHDNHYSTAYDLAMIARAGLQHPEFAKIVATRETIIPWPGKPWQRKLPNRNRLLTNWELCDGVKTGYTRQAGRCLAASATVGQWQLIGVVMKSQNSWQDARCLLTWGFEHYQQVVLAPAGQANYMVQVARGQQREVRAVPTADLTAVIRQGEAAPEVRQSSEVAEAPFAAGEVVGSLSVDSAVGGGPPVSLVAVEAVERSLLARLWDRKVPQLSLSTLVVLAVGVLIHGASAKAARARRRRQQARKRTVDRRGTGDRGRSDYQTGRPGRSEPPEHLR